MNRFDEPAAMLRASWNMIFRATVQSRHPFRSPVLGTVSRDGCRMRTVILREVDVQARRLMCYTDQRSDKVQQLRAQPRVSWHFYHPRKKLQVRARGTARLHHQDDVAERHWSEIDAEGRKDYAALQAPGTQASAATRGLPDFATDRPSAEDLAYAFSNFTVVHCTIDALDLLLLHRDGHQRVQGQWSEDGWAAHWVVA